MAEHAGLRAPEPMGEGDRRRERTSSPGYYGRGEGRYFGQGADRGYFDQSYGRSEYAYDSATVPPPEPLEDPYFVRKYGATFAPEEGYRYDYARARDVDAGWRGRGAARPASPPWPEAGPPPGYRQYGRPSSPPGRPAMPSPAALEGSYRGAIERGHGWRRSYRDERELRGAFYPGRERPAGERARELILRGGAQPSFAGVGPRGYRRSDERIWDDVNAALTRDPWVDATDIDVHVENGEVTLRGVVDDRLAKRRAEDVAAAVRGVTDVHNELRLRRSEVA